MQTSFCATLYITARVDVGWFGICNASAFPHAANVAHPKRGVKQAPRFLQELNHDFGNVNESMIYLFFGILYPVPRLRFNIFEHSRLGKIC